MTATLTDFLLARIAEDEAAARAASPGGWQYGDVESVAGGMLYDETRTIASLIYEQRSDHDGSIVRHLLSDEADANGAHIARHDPARVLAECEAKRRIVERHGSEGPTWYHGDEPICAAHGDDMEPWPCADLRDLASVYADHDQFREEWSV